MDEDKIKFAKTSLEKSKNFPNDPLIKFVILWIGFNALYDNNNDREQDKVSRYLSANEEIVKELLKSKNTELKEVVDFVNQTRQHSRISKFIKTRRAFLKPETDNSVLHFSQFIYKIRNNMFHSEKPWNQENEAKLLEMVNPIVIYMLLKFIEKK